MELDAINGAATVALTSTIAYLFVAKTWNFVSRNIAVTPYFADSIMNESAHQMRSDIERLSRALGTYLGGALVFVTLFVAAYLLQANRLFTGYPTWQLTLQVTFVVLVIGFAITHLGNTIRKRRRFIFARDASIAIGHQLQQLANDGARVFHDVHTDAGIIDHVIIGPKGVYTIDVIARKSSDRGRASLSDDQITLTASNADDIDTLSLSNSNAKTERLRANFSHLLERDIHVRSVIALPGWDIAEQTSDRNLIVNEYNVAMLSGWNDRRDFLMNEDVISLQSELRTRCLGT